MDYSFFTRDQISDTHRVFAKFSNYDMMRIDVAMMLRKNVKSVKMTKKYQVNKFFFVYTLPLNCLFFQAIQTDQLDSGMSNMVTQRLN